MDEAIDFRRSAALPGVEVLNARNTEREWRWFNTAYSIAVPTTWIGGVHYRGRYMGTTPGMVFCSAPGEIHVTQSGQRGTFHVLLFETEVFQSMAREAGATAEVTWGQIVGEPPAALRRLALALVNGIGETDDFAQQSLFTELFSGLAADLLESPIPRAKPTDRRRAARIREALHGGTGKMDLPRLTAETGLDRFQLLRTFKRAYGITPQAYQLCLRVGRARELLKDGVPPSAVAADCGFADQSHLGRHFKRLVGVTPGQYRMEPGPAVLSRRDP